VNESRQEGGFAFRTPQRLLNRSEKPLAMRLSV